MPAQSKVTRADVARLAGVSPSVVSFTLNGGPRPVAAATAERVRAAAERLGYVPDTAARALRGGTSGAIALLVGDFMNPHDQRLAVEVQRAAGLRSVGTLVTSTLAEPSATLPMLRHLDAGRLDGIILSATLPEQALAAAADLQTRLIQLDCTRSVPGAVHLHADFVDGARMALAHLVELGHASIGLLADPSQSDVRELAWGASHRERRVPEGPYVAVPATREHGYEGMARMLADRAPSAVLVGSCAMAVGAVHAVRDAGMRVPDDISVVSLVDSEELESSAPPITAVRLPLEAMAAHAVRAVYEEDAFSPDPHPYPTRLIRRGSTAPPRAEV